MSPAGRTLGGRARPLVVVTWPSFDPDDPETGGLLTAAGLRVRHAPKTGARSVDEVRTLMADASAAIVSTDPFDRSVFASAPQLRVIARVGVGVDSIDLAAATETGVVVTTTPGANEETVADHTLALILAAVRRVIEHDVSVRRGEWNRAGPLTAWDLHGQTVGLVGYGAIGRAVARRLRGFDAEILVCDPAVAPERGIEIVDLETLLRGAFVVSLHLPLTESTRGLIGPVELELMRPDAILVNTARGELVDEASLERALATGRIRAAALDVFADEPPDRSRRLYRLTNVTLTPHVGGLSVDSIAEMQRLAVRSVVAVLQGHRPEGVVNWEASGSVRQGSASGAGDL